MKKVHQKEIVAVLIGVVAVVTIVFASQPKFLQGNFQFTQFTQSPSRDLTILPSVHTVAGSNSIQEGINSVMATAIENQGYTSLKALTVHYTSRDVTLTSFRLFLNGKDVTSSLDKESQAILAQAYTSRGQYTIRDFTLTSSSGLALMPGNNKLELKATSKEVTKETAVSVSLTSLTFNKDGKENTLTLTQ